MENLSKNYFLPYQLDWIQDESPLKLYEKSRRIGITYATSYRAVRKCLRQRAGSKFVQWVSSRDELTAKEFVCDYVSMWVKAANVIAKGTQGDWSEVVDEKHGVKALVVEFKNGSRILSLSSNPLAFAGKGGDILLDEFDLHQDQAALYDMAFPCTTWGGQLEIVSAYDSEGSEQTVFAELVKEAKGANPKRFSLHATTLDQAIEQGFVEKVNEVKARKGKPAQTREEFRAQIERSCRTRAAFNSQYDCVPNSASGDQAVPARDLTQGKRSYQILRLSLVGDAIPTDLVDPSCEPYKDVEFWRGVLPAHRSYAFGYDVARSGDLAAMWINAILHCYELQVLITFENCKFESQKAVADAIFKAAFVVGAGDKTGMGQPNCEWLETVYFGRFVGVNFSSLKVTLGTTLISMFEQHRQVIPIEPPEIEADIKGIRKVAAEGGKLHFAESKNPYNLRSHCDMGWAAAMAIHAGETLGMIGPCELEPNNAPDKAKHPDDDDDKPRNERRDF